MPFMGHYPTHEDRFHNSIWLSSMPFHLLCKYVFKKIIWMPLARFIISTDCDQFQPIRLAAKYLPHKMMEFSS